MSPNIPGLESRHLERAELRCDSYLGRFGVLQMLRHARELTVAGGGGRMRSNELLLCGDKLLLCCVVLASERGRVVRRGSQLSLEGGDLHMKQQAHASIATKQQTSDAVLSQETASMRRNMRGGSKAWATRPVLYTQRCELPFWRFTRDPLGPARVDSAEVCC